MGFDCYWKLEIGDPDVNYHQRLSKNTDGWLEMEIINVVTTIAVS